MNITCNPSDAFDITSDEITLKQYPDSLSVYFSGTDTDLNLTEAPGLVSPWEPKSPNEHVRVNQDDTEGPYTFVDKGYELSYYKNNFRNFKSGCIRFTAKKEDCKDDYAYQDLEDFQGIDEPNYYPIRIQTWKNGSAAFINFDVAISEQCNDLSVLSAAINEAISDRVAISGTLCTEVVGNCLRFRTLFNEGVATPGYIKVADEGNETSLDLWFGKKHEPSYFSAPDVDTKILSLHEKDSTNNEVSIIHKTDGWIYVFMSDETSKFTITKKICQWEWSNEDFTEFELNFDESLSNFLANGKVKSFFETMGVSADGTEYDSVIRSDIQNTYLTLVGGGDAYGFREIDLFNKKQHCGAYDAPESVASYNEKEPHPYIEYNFGDLKVYDDSKLTITGEGDMLLEAFDNGTPLTYKDPTTGETITVAANNIEDFIKLFEAVDYDPNSTLSFDADDLTIRVTYLDKDAEITGLSLDPGTPTYDPNDPYNFEDLYGWVRRQCGAPQVTCELTDDQIYDALCRAVEKYNKYRNWNENLNISDIGGLTETDLKKVHGDKSEGDYFLLPANINPKDIVDIYFQPRFSTCWFGAGDTFLNNVMAQTFFGLYGGIVQNSADYYIWRLSCNDISNIIGTQISWRIYNGHLYLTPNNLHDLDQFKVGIKYRPALTVEEIRNSEDIKALTLAYAMRTLGYIRGTFGGSVQAGDIVIQLNAEMLLNEADKLEEKTINLLKSEQKPLWIMWT